MRFTPFVVVEKKIVILNVATFPPTHYRASPHFSQQKKIPGDPG